MPDIIDAEVMSMQDFAALVVADATLAARLWLIAAPKRTASYWPKTAKARRRSPMLWGWRDGRRPRSPDRHCRRAIGCRSRWRRNPMALPSVGYGSAPARR